MRIAFISYEFPPETGGGGIATYLAQAADILTGYGHQVEVYTGKIVDDISAHQKANECIVTNYKGAVVRRLHLLPGGVFRREILNVFRSIHDEKPFDVIEGTDFDASALDIKRAYPNLPYVVKLHTPRFAVDELHYQPMSFTQKVRFSLGAIAKGRLPKLPQPIRSTREAQAEIESIELADGVAAPSIAIKNLALKWASISEREISVFPYPYVPSTKLLNIKNDQFQHRVTFIGRLEARKGVIDLVDAIPAVKRQYPQAKFRFVGKDIYYSKGKMSMRDYLTDRIPRDCFQDVEFTGAVSHDRIPDILEHTDVAVFPSHWESFGLVCCEAMAANRAVIGSENGGMAEILDYGECGALVPPKSSKKIAEVILRLFSDSNYRISIANAGRERILKCFSPESVLPMQIACYEKAIERCKNRYTA